MLISKKKKIDKIYKRKQTIVDIKFKQEKDCEKILYFLRVLMGE